MSRDDRADFDVGYRLKSGFSGKPGLPRLRRLSLPPARTAKNVGWLTALFANIQAENAGRRDAQARLPRQDAKPFKTEKEIGILAKRKSRVVPVANYLRTIVRHLVEWIAAHRPINKIEDVPSAPDGKLVSVIQQQTQDKLDRVEERFRRDLADARQRERTAALGLVDFKKDNDLTNRDAEYADTVLKPIMVLLAAFLIDGLLNASFFAGASSSGFVGGLVVAFILSAINLVVGIATGLIGFRLVRHKEQWRQYFGWPALVLGLILLFLINFTIAHFREVAEASIREAQALVDTPGYEPVSIENMDMARVFQHMVQHPFEFGTIYSYLLFFTGVLVAIVGLLEGYRGLFGAGFFDRYWGFAGADRRLKGARKRVDKLQRDRRELLDRLFENHQAWAMLNRQTHDHFKDQIESGVAILNQHVGNSAAFEENIGNHARRVIARYQGANERERTKLGIENGPPYFGADPASTDEWRSAIPYDAIKDAGDRANNVLTTITHNIRQLDSYLAWLAIESQARNRLPPAKAESA